MTPFHLLHAHKMWLSRPVSLLLTSKLSTHTVAFVPASSLKHGLRRAVLQARPYSPFRGNDSEERLNEHLKNLNEEAKIESTRQSEFMKFAIKDMERNMRVTQMVDDRQGWSSKFTSDERDFIDNVIGSETFKRIVKSFKYEMRFDNLSDLHPTFHALEIMRAVANQIKDLAGEMPPKEVWKMLADRQENRDNPSKPPHIGFPSNKEVIAYYENWIDCLKRDNIPIVAPFPSMESPFGPISSSSCYEEMESVTLNDLLKRSFHGIIPNSKMLLRIRHKAIVSPSKIVTTVVEDEDGQYVLLQIHNMRDVEFNTDGLDFMPVGAFFMLKNPLFKIGNDRWQLLRVDQPFDLERLDVPPLDGSILIVGDGDFSFSAALAKENHIRGNASIVATSLDSRETVMIRYEKGREILMGLENDPNLTILHGVDATDLSRFEDHQFDSIVWNFPYPADVKGAIPSSHGHHLLSCFLDGLAAKLNPNDGRVYITLATKQGGTTNEVAARKYAWDVESLATNAGMDVVDVFPFDEGSYNNYEPRRAYADMPFPTENARTHVLRPSRQGGTPGDQASQRTILSRSFSLFLDSTAYPDISPIYRSEIIGQLEVPAETSSVAKSLLEAAQACEEAKMLLEGDCRNFVTSEKVVRYLSRVVCTENGELVMQFTHGQLLGAISCTIEVLSGFVHSTQAWELRAAGSTTEILRTFRRLVSPETGKALLEKPLHVLSVLSTGFMNEQPDSAMEIIQLALSMVPKSKELLYLRAAHRANLMTEGYPTVYSTEEVIRVVQDCDAALDEIQDESQPRYSATIYLLARMNLDLGILAMSDCSPNPSYFWKAIALYEKFLDLTDRDDRDFAPVHYRLGLAHCILNSISDTTPANDLPRSYYVAGLSAEKNRLSFFGPSVCPFKRLLAISVMPKEDGTATDKGSATKVNACFQKKNGSSRAGIVDSTKKAPSENSDKELVLQRIAELLSSRPEGIYLGMFRQYYSENFGDVVPMMGYPALHSVMEIAEEEGICVLEKRGKTEYWIRKPSSKKSTKKEKTKPINDPFLQNLWQLLNENPNGINFKTFRPVYTGRFGKHLAPRRELRKMIKQAEEAGVCTLVYRGRRNTELWVMPKRSKK